MLACANFWLAALMGLLLAFDKFAHFLPGFVLANVFAHAHLAALDNAFVVSGAIRASRPLSREAA